MAGLIRQSGLVPAPPPTSGAGPYDDLTPALSLLFASEATQWRADRASDARVVYSFFPDLTDPNNIVDDKGNLTTFTTTGESRPAFASRGVVGFGRWRDTVGQALARLTGDLSIICLLSRNFQPGGNHPFINYEGGSGTSGARLYRLEADQTEIQFDWETGPGNTLTGMDVAYAGNPSDLNYIAASREDIGGGQCVAQVWQATNGEATLQPMPINSVSNMTDLDGFRAQGPLPTDGSASFLDDLFQAPEDAIEHGLLLVYNAALTLPEHQAIYDALRNR